MSWYPDLPYNALLCRYNEIGTKGRNRGMFVTDLAHGLERAFRDLPPLEVQLEHGRILLRPKGRDSFSPTELALVRERAGTVAGLSSLSPAFVTEPDLESLGAVLVKYYPVVARAFRQAHPESVATYAMRARRVDKSFPRTVEEIERHFAEMLLPLTPEFQVDLTHPNVKVEVEVRQRVGLVCFERVAGAGGLPAGSGGRVLALLSGGIDSPVACYQMMRRGCQVDYLTFHSEPYTPPAYLTKVTGIARRLNDYQKRGRLASVNLVSAQKAIRDGCRMRFRTVLYRRMMLRVATALAPFFGAKALVTGDNLGQVASQTLENMSVINEAAGLMVLRPLLTFDKLATMALARDIATLELSQVECPDSCTVFAPDNPALYASLEEIQAEEARLDIPSLLQQCLGTCVIINPVSGAAHEYSALTRSNHAKDTE